MKKLLFLLPNTGVSTVLTALHPVPITLIDELIARHAPVRSSSLVTYAFLEPQTVYRVAHISG